MRVTHPPEEPDSVKELQDLDGAFATQPGRVAKARGRHLAFALLDGPRQVGQLLHRVRVVVQVCLLYTSRCV